MQQLALKREIKNMIRMGDAYMSKSKYNKYRSNSQLNRGNKSVSIVSLSPTDHFNYEKDIIMNSPYNKGTHKKNPFTLSQEKQKGSTKNKKE